MDLKRIKILMISLFISFLCSLLLPFSTQASSRGIAVISDLSHKSGKLGTYRALIIVINDYKDPKIPDLETAVTDAKAMAELLRERYGFQVKLILDRKATRETIYQSLRKLALSTRPDDSVFIYYAGHGDLDRLSDDGWWIPADAKGGNPLTYLDNFLVQKHMRIIKARHVLLISDSCYSGTLFGQARAMPQVIDDKYYLSLYNEKSRWGMTSGNKTPVSDRGSGGHSVFAYQLLKELRNNEKPYISTQEIYTRIAPIVGNNSEQTPICRPILNTGDQGGEFVFVASSGGSVSVKKSISVKAEPAQLPPEGKVSFDDILKAEEVQRQAKEKWKGWQQAREKEYRSIKEIDESKNLTSKQKTVAWQRFFDAVSQDNPYSRRDDEMRSYSRSRLNHLLASIPKSVTETRVILRSKKSLVSNFKKMRKKYNFYDPRWNKKGDFNNDYFDNGDGTITDRATGLIWQKKGDAKLINLNTRDTYFGAEKYIQKLNKQRFAGHSNWRLPTTEELASLIESKKLKGNLHIDPVFSQTPICISADRYTSDRSSLGSFACFANFKRGLIISSLFDLGASSWRDKIIKTVHFKAVCSIR